MEEYLAAPDNIGPALGTIVRTMYDGPWWAALSLLLGTWIAVALVGKLTR